MQTTGTVTATVRVEVERERRTVDPFGSEVVIRELLSVQIAKARPLAEQGWPPAVEMLREAEETIAALDARAAEEAA